MCKGEKENEKGKNKLILRSFLPSFLYALHSAICNGKSLWHFAFQGNIVYTIQIELICWSIYMGIRGRGSKQAHDVGHFDKGF
jgi:hypothetical protein